MGKIDIETKRYMTNPEVFADAFNYYLHQGQPVIRPEALREVDPTELTAVYGNGAHIPVQKFRDILKMWTVKRDKHAVYMVLGIENQSHIHYAMPVRNMLYDALHYSSQADMARQSYRRRGRTRKRQLRNARRNSDEFLSGFRREDRLLPLITLVIYFGTSEWDGPRSLHEMMLLQDEKLLKFVADYRLNIITPAEFSETAAGNLITDFPLLMKSIRNCGDKETFAAMAESTTLQEMSVEAAEILRLATGFRINRSEDKEVETVELAKGVREYGEDKKAEGRAEGRMEGRAEAEAQAAVIIAAKDAQIAALQKQMLELQKNLK